MTQQGNETFTAPFDPVEPQQGAGPRFGVGEIVRQTDETTTRYGLVVGTRDFEGGAAYIVAWLPTPEGEGYPADQLDKA